MEKWKHSIPKFMGCSKCNSKRDVNRSKCLQQEKEESQIKTYLFTLKSLEKEE